MVGLSFLRARGTASASANATPQTVRTELMKNTGKTISGNRTVPGKDDRLKQGRESRARKPKEQADDPANNHPEEDPAEGSRHTVEHELDRQDRLGRGASQSTGEAKRARDELPEQVRQQTELPGRGSA
ncbi:hypothetical protein NKI20_26140 [Mesorhizobium sp. M0830]|uniref:hypothetical protein n=1 Tax=Mesorhizobium sp. M0830 TaxID=2957008 RepID=UPI00333820DD